MKIVYRIVAAAILILAACAFMAQRPQQKQQEGRKWVSLFNGRNLDGWEAPTAGKWFVEDGVIVVHRDGQDRSGGWLVTKKDYGDFILRMKFKPGAKVFNSGILIRDPGHAKIGRPAFNGFEIQLAQGEGGKDENTSGAIYDVSRSYYREIGEQEWVSFEVQCIGDHIVTFMNGQKMAEAHTRRSYYGGIGMQIHGGADPVDYQFKDLEISELPAGSRPSQLMEEKLEGAPGDFEPLPIEIAKGWSLENGVLRGTGDQAVAAATKTVYGAFILDFSFRLSKGGQAGIDLRSPGGYEYRLSETDDENPTGSVVGVARAYELDPCLQKVYHPGQWNQARIYVSGDHVVTYLNKVHLAEGQGPRRSPGPIGLHVATGSTIEYRSLKIKRIAAAK